MRTMKCAVMTMLLIMVSALVGAREYTLPVSGSAAVSFLEGSAVLVVGDETSPLEVNHLVEAPATVRVGPESRMELTLADKSVLRFSAGTEFTLISADYADRKRKVDVDVALGDCWAKVQGLLGEESTFLVNSPTAVAGVAGTVYRLRVNLDLFSNYFVYDGEIEVGYRPVSPSVGSSPSESQPTRVQGPTRVPGPHEVSLEEWLVIVAKGYQFSIAPDGSYAPPKPFDTQKDKEDPWVAWNLERDTALRF
ncbi:MAG: hypothetical protein EOM25_06655 [Deltaproteobacteria bacterium]|nr:hypothetical protein [Deltaproteobacteria bacterium]